MHALLEELLRILEQELASYRCLRELLQVAQRLIIACDSEELARQMGVQEELLASLSALDRDRATRVDAVSERLGLPPEERTTTGLAAHLAPVYGDRMRSVARELIPLLTEIGQISDDNRFLLENSRSFLEATLRQLMKLRAPRPAGIYGRGGTMKVNEQHVPALSVNRQA